MAKISVYDPPMCCSTGVCGPDEDDIPAMFAAALDWAQKNGAEIERYNLGHQPGAFTDNATVKGLLDSDGMDCLPLVLVDDEVFVKGDYPSRDALGARLGLGDAPAVETKATASQGCCPTADAT